MARLKVFKIEQSHTMDINYLKGVGSHVECSACKCCACHDPEALVKPCVGEVTYISRRKKAGHA